ncbi:MAG: hypothetical protein JNL74_22325 [Fibrobacteres bacterium]|nr:hypothetical protein [Fibrobacterota bacterium]
MKYSLISIILVTVYCFGFDAYVEKKKLYENVPDVNSIISPCGNYYVRLIANNEFEIRNTIDGQYVLQSRYCSRQVPYLNYKNSGQSYFVFSPDDKKLFVDRYIINDSLPIRWIECWDITGKRMEKFIRFDHYEWPLGTKIGYNLKSKLSSYYNRKPVKGYTPGRQLLFSEDGTLMISLYPWLRIFEYPSLREMEGEFQKPILEGPLFHKLIPEVDAPVAIDRSGSRWIFPEKGRIVIYNNFLNNKVQYYTVEERGSWIELDRDFNFAFFDGSYYSSEFRSVQGQLGGNPYLSHDGRYAVSNNTLYKLNGYNYESVPQLYNGFYSFVTASSDRSFFWLTDTAKRELVALSFENREKFQTINLNIREYFFKESDNGKVLFLKDSENGHVRIFKKSDK